MNQQEPQVDLQYYVEMFKMQKQIERLRDITVLKIKIQEYQQDFSEIDAYTLNEILKDQCKIFKERIKEDQCNQNENFSSLITESQSDQEDIIIEQKFTQIKQNYQLKIQDGESCQGSCKLLLQILDARIQQKIETIILIRYNLLGLFKNHNHGNEIIWKFPQVNFKEHQIQQYILYVMQKKINFFKNMFDIPKLNMNLNEIYFMIMTFLEFKQYYEGYQKIIIYENILDYLTKKKFTNDDSTIIWAYGINCLANQQNNLSKLKQILVQIQGLSQTELQDEEKDIQFSNEQIKISPTYASFLKILNMNQAKISNLIEQIKNVENVQEMVIQKLGFMNEQKFFEDQLLMISKIINSSIFQNAIGDFNKYMAIYDPQLPNLDKIQIFYIYQQDLTTLGKTCFDGSIYVNLYQLLRKYNEENINDFKKLLKGWIINIFTHEYFHYLLRYCTGSYNCYTPKLLQRKRNEKDINWYQKVQYIMDYPQEAGFIGQQFIYQYSEDDTLVKQFNIQFTDLIFDFSSWEDKQKFQKIFKHSQAVEFQKHSIKMFDKNEFI